MGWGSNLIKACVVKPYHYTEGVATTVSTGMLIFKNLSETSPFKWRGKSEDCSNLKLEFWIFFFFPLLLSRCSHIRLCATPINGSPPGSAVPGILQARTLEWVAISFSNAWKGKVKVKSLSYPILPDPTPWTAAYQAPLSMGFSRQEYWSGVPSLSPFFPMRSCNFASWIANVVY